MRTSQRLLATLMVLLWCGAAKAGPRIEPSLEALAPKADPTVIELALEALDCAEPQGSARQRRLALIDYSRPSDEPRLWVFDLARRELLFEELVAHGRGSGDERAERFSNVEGSFKSSLGLFRTGEAYVGHNGYSLRLRGLEPGINDHAMERAIVIHGADYVSPAFALKVGRLGRSLGCPAVAHQVNRPLIDTIKDGHYLFSYYPDPSWMSQSRFVGCKTGRTYTASRSGR